MNDRLLQRWMVFKIQDISSIVTVQPFDYVKSGCFLITDESRKRGRCEPQGVWKHATLETFLCSERVILSKMFAKLIVIFMPIFICVFSHFLYSYNCLHFRSSLELQSPATEEPAAAQYSGAKRFLHDGRHQSCFSDHGQMRERSKNYEIRVSSIELLIDSVVNRSFMEAILIQRWLLIGQFGVSLN